MDPLIENELRRLRDALKVIVLTPHIRGYLKANDPTALRQAKRALLGWEDNDNG